MIKESVTHIKYGVGTIVEVNGNHISVDFGDSEKIRAFVYPDSFDRFLSFQNKLLQAKVEMTLCIVKDKAAKELELKRLEDIENGIVEAPKPKKRKNPTGTPKKK